MTRRCATIPKLVPVGHYLSRSGRHGGDTKTRDRLVVVHVSFNEGEWVIPAGRFSEDGAEELPRVIPHAGAMVDHRLTRLPSA
jgi:hypothetical protein